MYCRRAGCAMLSGGKPCREANRAAGLLRDSLNAEKKERERKEKSSAQGE